MDDETVSPWTRETTHLPGNAAEFLMLMPLSSVFSIDFVSGTYALGVVDCMAFRRHSIQAVAMTMRPGLVACGQHFSGREGFWSQVNGSTRRESDQNFCFSATQK
jgi:hypothetical protein